MRYLGLASLLVFALTILCDGSISVAADPNAEADPAGAAESEHKPLPEDRDWLDYVGDANNTAEMNARCLEAYAILDKRMSVVFEQLLATIDDESDALAKQNHADWKRYALSKRSFAADQFRGGTLAGPAAGINYIEELCRRIHELKNMTESRRPL